MAALVCSGQNKTSSTYLCSIYFLAQHRICYSKSKDQPYKERSDIKKTFSPFSAQKDGSKKNFSLSVQ